MLLKKNKNNIAQSVDRETDERGKRGECEGERERGNTGNRNGVMG